MQRADRFTCNGATDMPLRYVSRPRWQRHPGCRSSGQSPGHRRPGLPVDPARLDHAPPPGVWPPAERLHPIAASAASACRRVRSGRRWSRPHVPISLPEDAAHAPTRACRLDRRGTPTSGLPGSPPRPDHGLPSQTFCAMRRGIPGFGSCRYIAVDPSSVSAGHQSADQRRRALPRPGLASRARAEALMT